MMKRTLCLIGLTCLGATAVPALAAEGPTGPPKVLQIFREEVKPGKSAAHEKVEAGWPRAFEKANVPIHYIAMVSMTGVSEAWFCAGYDSIAAWEKDNALIDANMALKAETDQLSEKDGELLSGGRSLLLVYRQDLSRNATADIAQMRYFRVSTFRLKPGHERDFADNVKIVKDAYDKAKIDVGWAIYQVNAGMQGPTFMVWQPMKSLSEADDALARVKTIQDAEGEEGQKALAKAAGEGYATVESQIYSFNPKMSHPGKEFAARDAGFWTPKPAEKKEARKADKKEAPKPAEKK